MLVALASAVAAALPAWDIRPRPPSYIPVAHRPVLLSEEAAERGRRRLDNDRLRREAEDEESQRPGTSHHPQHHVSQEQPCSQPEARASRRPQGSGNSPQLEPPAPPLHQQRTPLADLVIQAVGDREFDDRRRLRLQVWLARRGYSLEDLEDRHADADGAPSAGSSYLLAPRSSSGRAGAGGKSGPGEEHIADL